jgi:hypothetical protein
MATQEESIIIVGRSVTDYAANGAQAPRDAKIVPCGCCGVSLALGPTGKEMLAKAKRSFVFCAPCLERVSSKGQLPVSEIRHSSEMKEQIERNPGVAERVTSLERKLKPKVN